MINRFCRWRQISKGTLVACYLAIGALGSSGQNAWADEVRILAKNGDPVSLPGESGEFTIARILTGFHTLGLPSANTSGYVAFLGQIAGPGITTSNNQAVLRYSPVTNSIDVVTHRRQAAPTLIPLGDAYFNTFSDPDINESGWLCFSATIAGGQVIAGYNDKGYWCAGPETPVFPVLQDRMSGPLANSLMAGFSDIQVAKRGAPVLSFSAGILNSVLGASSYMLGLRASTISTPNSSEDLTNELVAAYNFPVGVPGFDGVRFGGTQRVQGESGAKVLFGSLTGTGVTTSNNRAIWYRPASSQPGGLSLLARTGDPAPGMPGFSYHGFAGGPGSQPIITSSDDVIFAARVADSTGTFDYGLWRSEAGATPVLLVKGTDPAPQIGEGNTVGLIYNPTATPNVFGGGRLPGSSQYAPITFVSTALRGSVSGSNTRVLWRLEPSGSLRALAQAEVQAPDVEAGTSITKESFGSVTVGNRRGDVAMMALLHGPAVTANTDFAYFATRDGQLRLLAREGQQIEGTDWQIFSLTAMQLIYMNDRGQLFFTALLSHDTIGSDARGAFLHADENGALRISATEGFVIQTVDGTQASIGTFGANPASCLTDSGNFVFNSTLSGIPNVYEGIISLHITPDAPPPQCPADFNHDGRSTLDDLFAFLTPWFSQDSAADFNHDGNVTNQDLFDFINAWFGGCP